VRYAGEDIWLWDDVLWKQEGSVVFAYFIRAQSKERAGAVFLKLDIIGICILDRIYRIMQDK